MGAQARLVVPSSFTAPYTPLLVIQGRYKSLIASIRASGSPRAGSSWDMRVSWFPAKVPLFGSDVAPLGLNLPVE